MNSYWTNCQKSTWIEVCKKKCFFKRACLKLINPIQNINHRLSWKYEKKIDQQRNEKSQCWRDFFFGLKHWTHFLHVMPAVQWPSPSLLAISEKTERLPSTSMLIKEILFSIDCRLENSSYECRTLAKFFHPNSVFFLKKNQSWMKL